MSEDLKVILLHIEKVLALRKWVFGAIFLLILLIAITQCTMMVTMGEMRKDREEDKSEIRSNSAKIDAAIAQMIVYQRQTVQYWDELSRQNPKLKVPRAVVTSPGGKSDLSAEDLKRADSPTPTPKPKVIIKYRLKPTPTPGLKWPWQH